MWLTHATTLSFFPINILKLFPNQTLSKYSNLFIPHLYHHSFIQHKRLLCITHLSSSSCPLNYLHYLGKILGKIMLMEEEDLSNDRTTFGKMGYGYVRFLDLRVLSVYSFLLSWTTIPLINLWGYVHFSDLHVFLSGAIVPLGLMRGDEMAIQLILVICSLFDLQRVNIGYSNMGFVLCNIACHVGF